MNSKLFIITLFAALSALVAASTATNNEALVVKREALSARMHARAAAGHGALKKRVPTDEAKERIKRAQYHPTRTAAAAPGMEKGMEKRQLVNVGLNPVNVPIIGAVPIVCVDVFGQPLYIVGCPAKPTASQSVCQAQPKQQCNPTYAIAGSVSNGLGGVIGGVSSCCPFGFACSQFGNLGGSYCLSANQLRVANSQLGGITFGSQQTITDYLNRVLG